MMEIYYLSAKGEKLNLTEWPYRIQTGDILNYKKSYTFFNASHGGVIQGFNSEVSERNVVLTVAARTMDEYYNSLNHFYRIVDSDVVNLTPGRLYVNGQYMRCYIFGSEKTEWEYGCNFLDNTIFIVSGNPQWVTESTKAFHPVGSDTGYPHLDYPYDYDYDYAPDIISVGHINLDHYAPCKYLLKIYGPAINPAVTIGGIVRQVYTTLEAGQYLLIDSRDKTVKRVLNDGAVLSEFDNRRRGTKSIFEPITPGMNGVTWNNAFGFDLTLFIERSEPEWR